MSTYRFSNDELIYLASYVGADDLYGIEDSLSSLSDAQLKLKVVDIEDSLSDKKVLRVGFDDEKSIHPEVAGMMEICAKSESIIVINNRTKNDGICSYTYYAKEGRIVEIKKSEMDYALSDTTEQKVRNELEKVKLKKVDGNLEHQIFTVLNTNFEKCSSLARKGRSEKALDILKDSDVTEDVGKMVVDGLNVINGKTDFYSVLFAKKNLVSSEQMYESIVMLKDKDLILISQDIDENDRAIIRLEVSDLTTINHMFENGMKIVDDFNFFCSSNEALFS